ncbi:MAG: S41 family peptidase [Deltaproteobacteria bacterium]|nr:S41 family peptidase [Deltaproteobacteria bacterium]MBN2673904.1 S41 family peptidase [Deltaproteobacteria bacterium]
MKMNHSPYRPPGAQVALAFAVACTLWIFSTSAAAKGASKGPYRKLNIFSSVLSLIEQNHVEDIHEDELIIGAIEGMLRALDPHSSFLTQEEFTMLKEDTEGNFCGVGMEVGIKDNRLTVISPIPDSPAVKAGILPGDRIIKIDGLSTDSMDLMEAVQRMRGKEGTDVTITIEREGEEKPFEVVLTRAVIELQSVEAELLAPGIAHIKIKSFQDGTAAGVRDQIKHMRLIGGGLDGIVLDLRRNPGGLMYEAVKVCDLFISEGTLLSTKGRGGVIIESFSAHRAGTFDEPAMVVLIDGASASASEIVAGALQDHGRAMLVGMNSFGKGSVQTIIPLQDGSGLKLTTARYYTPAGRSIQARGIEPDVVVESLNAPAPDELTQSISQMPAEDDLPGHLKKETVAEKQSNETPVNDYQLRMGYQILQGLVRAKAAKQNE